MGIEENQRDSKELLQILPALDTGDINPHALGAFLDRDSNRDLRNIRGV